MSPNKVFVFLINPPAPAPSGKGEIQKFIAKHEFECFKIRKEWIEKKTECYVHVYLCVVVFV